MSGTAVQSRKMCFVEVEDEAKALFEEAFAEHDVSFAGWLDDVPEDTEIVSVFITKQIDSSFLDDHPLIRLIATRSTGCDHIDLDVSERRGVGVANVGNYEVVLTPHVAFNSHEAMERLTGITVENINAYLKGRAVGHTSV